MEDIENLTLAKIVTLKPQAAQLLEKYNLDYCCGGKKTLHDALSDNAERLDEIKIELDIIFSKKNSDSEIKYDDLSLTQLVDHIISKHHAYVKEYAPIINEHLKKVADKHGLRHPSLIKIKQLFDDVKREMENHMMKEEVILFPRIKSLETVQDNHDISKESIQTPINVMMKEHDIAGGLMNEIRKLTWNYLPLVDACTTFRLTFDELRQFEEDLHLHVHLENNILFPKALAMKDKMGSILLN